MNIDFTENELLAVLCCAHHYIVNADKSYRVSRWDCNTGESDVVLTYEEVKALLPTIRDKIQEVLNA